MSLHEKLINRVARSQSNHSPNRTTTEDETSLGPQRYSHLSANEVRRSGMRTNNEDSAPILSFKTMENASLSRSSPSKGRTDRHSEGVNTKSKQRAVSSSAFCNVSSDEEDDEEGTEGVPNTVDGSQQAVDLPPSVGESHESIERRSTRIRRSLTKARASLPVDFADRIELHPAPIRSPSRENSSIRRSSVTRLDRDATARVSDADSDEDLLTPVGDKGVDNDAYEQFEHDPYIRRDHLNSSSSTTSNNKTESVKSSAMPTITWSSSGKVPLEKLMAELRGQPFCFTYLLKATADKPGCCCALCSHECLLLYPIFDVQVAIGYWGSWSTVSKSRGRSFNERNKDSAYNTRKSIDVEAKLIVFRQCRGWYEVLNENLQPVPHLSTLEQFRRAKPDTFLIRRDLQCLAAPPTLVIPSGRETKTMNTNDGSASLDYNNSVLSTASSTEILAASTPEMIPAGTLMHYFSYLPHCSVKRGRKLKDLGLLLATKRVSSSNTSRKLSSSNTPLSRAYYIGLEDSTPSIFPSKFDISTIAGPENISGVHSMASVMRKFRLPLNLKPVIDPLIQITSDTNRSTLSSGSQSSLLSCGMSTVLGIQFGENKFLRLESVCRSDLLIISPVNCPERLFLITPTMLPDHTFEYGWSTDFIYSSLLENHRIHATNFLSHAHPRESLNYLLRHMRDITREPKDPSSSRPTSKTHRSTNGDADNNNLTEEELYQTYEDLDEIYFYIRHGYYPSRAKRLDQFPLRSRNLQGDGVAETDSSKRGMKKAEELLAASLAKNSISNAFSNRGMSNARPQTKEYGI